MANTGSSRAWIIAGFIALGVVLAATLLKPGSNATEEGDSDSSESSTASEYDPDGGSATRRIKVNCDPASEAQKYEEFVGREALAILSWTNMPEKVANLQIPVYVASVDEGAITVNVLDLPLKDPYIAAWIRSGHMRNGQGTSFLIDPCSARIEAWEEMGGVKDLEENRRAR
jgi:hypothetical protein